jgi:hypothetical protein
MKQLTLLAILFFALVSCKKETTTTVTIVDNCTGVYILKDGEHFKICNEEVLPSFTDSLVIDLSYEVITACDSDFFACEMWFPFTDWVEITEID